LYLLAVSFSPRVRAKVAVLMGDVGRHSRYLRGQPLERLLQ
jgi:hypothetical protein